MDLTISHPVPSEAGHEDAFFLQLMALCAAFDAAKAGEAGRVFADSAQRIHGVAQQMTESDGTAFADGQ
jgi:hypothetical protein